MCVEVTRPISEVLLHSSVERLTARVELNGEFLDTVELPVCDGFVPAKVISDQIATDIGWTILGAFLKENVYSKEPARSESHEERGWVTLLQELWGRPDWDNGKFYKAEESAGGNFVHVEGPWHVVEITEPLAGIETKQKNVEVVLNVGGSAVGSVNVAVNDGRVSGHELMVALNKFAGLELCRAAAREALVGRPLVDGKTLRQRLEEAAKARTSAGRRAVSGGAGVSFAPATEHTWASELAASQHVFALARRAAATTGTSASQFATLPSGALAELVQMAQATQQPVVELSNDPKAAMPTRVVYAPDLLWRSESTKPAGDTPLATPRPAARRFGRSYFETLHAAASDVRRSSEFEGRKREQMLSLIPPKIRRALEVGCGDGSVSELLSHRVGRLLAVDLSQIAVARAAKRGEDLKNVE
jgi:hypothetical protein